MHDEHSAWLAISAAIVGFIVVTVSAFAFGLEDEDYAYLKAQHIERDAAPMLDLSPKERARVHNLINDPVLPTIRLRGIETLKTRLPYFSNISCGKKGIQVNCGTRQRSERLLRVFMSPKHIPNGRAVASRARRGAPDSGQHRQAAGAVKTLESSAKLLRAASNRVLCGDATRTGRHPANDSRAGRNAQAAGDSRIRARRI
jgi:hypothetical protein